MSVESFRRLADHIRALPGHKAFGLREYEITVDIVGYTGDSLGEGIIADREMRLTVYGGVPPKIRFPSQREIALGMAGLGTCIVGPFTPFYGSGGIPRGWLDGTDILRDKELLQFWIVGPNFPNGCAHRLDKFQVDKALQIKLELIQVEPTA